MKMFAVVFGVLAGAGPAIPATLDFSAGACDGPCAEGSEISQAYGDVVGQLNVVYNANTSAPDDQPLTYRRPTARLSRAAYSAKNDPFSILFLSDYGYDVSVSGLSLTNALSQSAGAQVTVTDLSNGGVLYSSGGLGLSGSSAKPISGPFKSPTGIAIAVTPDGEVGPGDIAYDIIPETLAPVPLPATALLLGGGLLGLFGLRRRNAG